MQKRSFQILATQTAPSMSPSHSYTIVAHDDDDDNDSDICPVCDGECTCHKTNPPPPQLSQRANSTPGVPLSMAELSLRYASKTASTPPTSSSSGQYGLAPVSTPPLPPPQPKASLKIKLTVPPGMLAKRRLLGSSQSPTEKSYKSNGETISDFASTGYTTINDRFFPSSSSKPPAKKRGRPPKASSIHATTVSQNVGITHSSSKLPGKSHPKRPSSSNINKMRQSFKSGTLKKHVKNRKKKMESSEDDSSSDTSDSELSDIDMGMVQTYLGDDAPNHSLPTFLPASALSSTSSDSSLSGFESDSSVEREEEIFIRADVHDKARLKRELLGGDDALLLQKKRNNSDWIIRPRKKSVEPSDVEMDVDSDATEDDEDEDENADEDEEDDHAALGAGEDDANETEEDVTMSAIIPPIEDEDVETTDDQRSRYVGFATGWSEDDDESSFDADLFFANLSGSSSSTDEDGGSDTDRSTTPAAAFRRRGFHPMSSKGEEGDQSDVSCTSECTESGALRHAAIESLPFEVTEGWDGQIVFTNGIHDHHGIVDLEFEADASRYVADSSSAAPSLYGDTEEEHTLRRRRRKMQGMGLGMDMSIRHSEGSDETDDEEGGNVEMGSEAGYEEEDGEGEGDTTDEELVGEDELPNERAMRLFSFPMSVSAINPLSTMSSPTVSPSRRRREDERSRERRRRRWGDHSPSAVDILAGRVTLYDSEEFDEDDNELDGGMRGRRGVSVFGGSSEAGDIKRGPRKGVFVPTKETRQAVIDDDKKGVHVPSPHPRFSRGRGRTTVGRYNSVEHLLRKHLHSISASISSTSSDAVALASALSPTPGAEEQSPLELLLSSAAAVAAANGNVEGAIENDIMMKQETEYIQLDDVLDSSFLNDPEPLTLAGNMSDSNVHGAGSQSGAEEESESVKNLSRWDVISVGAFRQTRETAWEMSRHLHTPHSSVDLGNAIKSSPLSSMVWQNAAGASAGSGSGAGNGVISTSGNKNAFKTIGQSGKLAKRRRLMMSSTMSSPLILPLGGNSSTAPTTPTSSTTALVAYTHDKHHHQQQQQQNNQNQKSRKELRRERKLMKKKSHGTPHAPHLSHSHHGHQFHTHHGHHSNGKMRSASSTQRSNFFTTSVPPLNL